ncbi:MAG: ATP-binding protein [Gammaproteobacteria bacterium]|nr:ATP-binding protein [Gammaproteobacteria bacterium]
MLSLTSRLLIAGSIILSAFLGLTGYALDQTYQQSAKEAQEARLLGHVMTLIAVAPVKLDGTIDIPKSLPLASFSRLDSGLYGKIVDEKGKNVWSSFSLGGNDFSTIQHFKILDSKFSETLDLNQDRLFRLSYGVSWDSANSTKIYTINIAVPKEAYEQDIERFRQLLWLWLGGVSILLLAAQGVILRWSLNPLRQAADEISRIEQGLQSKIEGAYPKDLKALTYNLNALIKSNKEHLVRHRNGLSDLAHSLKTPLAMIRSVSENNAPEKILKETISEQVDQMQKIVDYQLQRAGTSGRIPLSKPVNVNPVARKILNSLAKVYIEKSVEYKVEISNSTLFYGDESDLFEMLGNLLDNAFKWCTKTVVIRVNKQNKQTDDLVLTIEDDGPGIDSEVTGRIMERGVYSSKKQGTGIGLAIVKDILDAYEGAFQIEKSKLGGAKFVLYLKRLQ